MFIKILVITILIKKIKHDDRNKKLNPLVTELFIRGRKLNISLVFITQSHFKVPKDITLNTSHFFIAKILNKGERNQTANH